VDKLWTSCGQASYDALVLRVVTRENDLAALRLRRERPGCRSGPSASVRRLGPRNAADAVEPIRTLGPDMVACRSFRSLQLPLSAVSACGPSTGTPCCPRLTQSGQRAVS
jgi:hypothetical protein